MIAVQGPTARAKLLAILDEETALAVAELKPFFGTAMKKAGTRIVTMISLGVLLEAGLSVNDDISAFINKALEDRNELLVAEAKNI
jgi:glutaminyl-tRNA synthetase